MTEEYLTQNGEPIPENVAEHFAPAEEWFHHDPTAIVVESCLLCDDDIYLGETNESCPFCGSVEYCGATEWGQTHVEHVSDGGLYFPITGDGGVLCGACYEFFEEYGDSLIIVMPDGERFKIVYDGNVAMDWGEWFGDYEMLTGPALELAQAIVSGTRRVPVDGWRSYSDVSSEIESDEISFAEVGGGWHSTMDRSEFSDRLNEITSGKDVPPMPMAIRFGKTSNIFSIIVNVFVPSDRCEEAADFLGRATHSGIAGGISYVA